MAGLSFVTSITILFLRILLLGIEKDVTFDVNLKNVEVVDWHEVRVKLGLVWSIEETKVDNEFDF